jgi:pimeloyl-ACP methyl ester carboxylesterase
MPKTVLNGNTVHYLVRGEGPDVVLIHGITSTMAVWFSGVLPVLSRDYRVTVYDLRGHGYSSMTPTGYTSADMAGDLLALMDHLKIDRARLVGHSFGGSIALHAALLQPERVQGAVVSDTGIACLRHLRRIDDWPGWSMWKDQLEAHGITREGFTDDPEQIIRRSFKIPRQFGMRKGEPRGTRRLEKRIDETAVVKEFREVAGLTEERLTEIATPVLAMYGDTSPYRDMVNRLAGLLPHCHWEVLKGGGHFLLLQLPEVFVQLMAAFLRDPAGYLARAGETTTHDSTGFQPAGPVEDVEATPTIQEVIG